MKFTDSELKNLIKLANAVKVNDAEVIEGQTKQGKKIKVKVSDYGTIKFPFTCIVEENHKGYPTKITGYNKEYYHFDSSSPSSQLTCLVEDLYDFIHFQGTTNSEDYKDNNYGDDRVFAYGHDIKDFKRYFRPATVEEVKHLLRNGKNYGYIIKDSLKDSNKLSEMLRKASSLSQFFKRSGSQEFSKKLEDPRDVKRWQDLLKLSYDIKKQFETEIPKLSKHAGYQESFYPSFEEDIINLYFSLKGLGKANDPKAIQLAEDLFNLKTEYTRALAVNKSKAGKGEYR